MAGDRETGEAGAGELLVVGQHQGVSTWETHSEALYVKQLFPTLHPALTRRHRRQCVTLHPTLPRPRPPLSVIRILSLLKHTLPHHIIRQRLEQPPRAPKIRDGGRRYAGAGDDDDVPRLTDCVADAGEVVCRIGRDGAELFVDWWCLFCGRRRWCFLRDCWFAFGCGSGVGAFVCCCWYRRCGWRYLGSPPTSEFEG